MSATLVLKSRRADRALAVLDEPVPCPVCRRMAMLVVLTSAGGSCIGCSPSITDQSDRTRIPANSNGY